MAALFMALFMGICTCCNVCEVALYSHMWVISKLSSVAKVTLAIKLGISWKSVMNCRLEQIMKVDTYWWLSRMTRKNREEFNICNIRSVKDINLYLVTWEYFQWLIWILLIKLRTRDAILREHHYLHIKLQRLVLILENQFYLQIKLKFRGI